MFYNVNIDKKIDIFICNGIHTKSCFQWLNRLHLFQGNHKLAFNHLYVITVNRYGDDNAHKAMLKFGIVALKLNHDKILYF